MANVYIVTGAGGIGLNTAKLLGKRGGSIVLADASEKILDSAAVELKESGVEVTPVLLDVTDKENVRKLYETAKSIGEIQGVAHTAGVSMALGNVEKIMQINTLGTIYMNEYALEYLAKGGAMVNFSSGAALTVKMNPVLKTLFKHIAKGEKTAFDILTKMIHSPDSAYDISKRFVVYDVQYLTPQFGAKGLRINSVAPGTTETAMLKAFTAHHPGQIAMSLKTTPLKRNGQPEEQAAVVDFLLSDNASYVTGINVPCDGGISANTAMMPYIPKPVMDLMMKLMDKIPQSVMDKIEV